VWWACPEDSRHEWQATVKDRQKHGCPFCSGRRVTPDKSLAALRPDLLQEWHPTRNVDVLPDSITPQSSKKVWWQCKTNPDHEWQSTVNNRYNGNGCPYCSGRKATKATSLLAENPAVCKEWHPIKNGDLTPDQVRPNSHRKAWWQCSRNPKHEWNANIQSRNRGAGCPYCAGKKTLQG
jgi:hypothetical protein